MTPRVSFLHKAVLVTLSTALAVSLLNLIGDKYRPGFLSEQLQAIFSMVLLASVPVSLLVWQRAAARNRRWSESLLPFFQSVLVWCIAAIFFRFGMLKLLHLHMNSSLFYEDVPAGSLTGYALMDYFFSRAPAFKVLLAVLQLFGATCLLFRRLRMLGILTLLPIVANIVLMDFFYQVGTSITIAATLLLLGLAYLLVQDAAAIRDYLRRSFQQAPRLAFSNKTAKQVLRVCAALVPVLLLVPHYHRPQTAAIAGKYEVLSAQSALSSGLDSLPSAMYLDENDDCIFRYGAHNNLKVGKALFNAQTRRLVVLWRYPKGASDTLRAVLSAPDAQHRLTLTGLLGAVPLNLHLQAVRPPQPGL